MSTNMRSDVVIAAWLNEGPTALTRVERSAIADAAEGLAQRRSALPLSLTAARRLLVIAAAGALVVASTALLLIGGPSPAPSVSPAPPSAPTLTTAPTAAVIFCQSEAPNPLVTWSGRVRTDLAGMPVCTAGGRIDPRDAQLHWVDIVAVRPGPEGRSWGLGLAARPPAAGAPDRAGTVVEYGFVFETTGDGVADYVIGINNDGSVQGNYRVWVTRLATNETTERIGPPYGHPVDFAHPDEQSARDAPGASGMRFSFIGPPPWGGSGGPDGYIPGDAIRFYAWASVTSGSELLAWDYAPDYAWLEVPATQH